jgi:hypothetical protein
VKSASNGVTASQPGTPSVALREIQPTATRSPGGPVWYRNPSKGNGISSRLQELAAEPNSALYDDLPRLREEGNRQRSASPARSTLKGKARAGSHFEEEGEEEDPRWAGAESESQSSSVSGLSSYDDDDDYNNQQQQPQQQMVPRSVETPAGSRQRALVGPRQLVPTSDRSSSNNTIMARARSEPPVKEATKPATLGPLRLPEPIALRADHSSGSRNPSGSSLGKRSRSVDHTHPHHPNPSRHRSSSSSSSSSRSGIEDDDHQGPKKIIKTTQPLNVRKSISDKKPAPDHPLHNKKKKKNDDQDDDDEKSAAVQRKNSSGAGGEMNHQQHQDEDEEDTLSCVDNHLLLGGDRAASVGKIVGREDQDEADEDIGTTELVSLSLSLFLKFPGQSFNRN